MLFRIADYQQLPRPKPGDRRLTLGLEFRANGCQELSGNLLRCCHTLGMVFQVSQFLVRRQGNSRHVINPGGVSRQSPFAGNDHRGFVKPPRKPRRLQQPVEGFGDRGAAQVEPGYALCFAKQFRGIFKTAGKYLELHARRFGDFVESFGKRFIFQHQIESFGEGRQLFDAFGCLPFVNPGQGFERCRGGLARAVSEIGRSRIEQTRLGQGDACRFEILALQVALANLVEGLRRLDELIRRRHKSLRGVVNITQ